MSTAGAYTLRLTASDGTLSSSDDVVITVNAAPSVNQAPVVNAGPDLTITLPNGITLAGTATDDGLPTGSTLTKTWAAKSPAWHRHVRKRRLVQFHREFLGGGNLHLAALRQRQRTVVR